MENNHKFMDQDTKLGTSTVFSRIKNMQACFIHHLKSYKVINFINKEGLEI